jgi:hypothetical protein
MLIGKDYKIESGTLNITLFKRATITGTGRGKRGMRAVGETYWRPIAYFSNPQNALDYLVNNEVCDTGLKDLETVVKKIKELHELIVSLPLESKARN